MAEQGNEKKYLQTLVELLVQDLKKTNYERLVEHAHELKKFYGVEENPYKLAISDMVDEFMDSVDVFLDKEVVK